MTNDDLWRPLANACEDFLAAVDDDADPTPAFTVLRRELGLAQMALDAQAAGGMTPRSLVCAGCARTFAWTPRQAVDPSPRWCSAKCRNARMNEQRAEFARRLDAGEPLCPQPLKRAYRSWAEADEAVARTPDSVGGLAAYRCACGAFHIGHPKRRSA